MSVTTLDPGLDLTALFGSYASAITEAIQKASPAAPFCFIVYDVNPPDTFTYAWLKRALWVKPDGVGGIQLMVFDDVVLHDWKNILSLAIPAGSIGTTQLANLAVTLGKMATAEALKLIQMDAAGVAWQYVNPEDALQANTVAVTKLLKPASGDKMITCIAGTIAWTLLSDILSFIADNSIGVIKLAKGAASARGLFLNTDAVGTTIGWVAFDPNTHIADGTVPIKKLVVGTNGQRLEMTGGLPAWVTPPAIPSFGILRYAPASATAPQSIPNTTNTTVTLDGAATFDPDGVIFAIGTNQFSLVPGKYQIRAHARIYGQDPGSARMYIYNKSDSAEVISDTFTAATNDDDVYELEVEGGVVLTAIKDFDLRVWHNFGGARNLGVAASLAGKAETYVKIVITRYA